MEHLNHVVSGAPSPRDPTQPQQWVSSQVLLCRRCSHHQTTKIKQLAAFTPREEVSMQIAVNLLLAPLSRMCGFFLSWSELGLSVILWPLGEHRGNQGVSGQKGFPLSSAAVLGATSWSHSLVCPA